MNCTLEFVRETGERYVHRCALCRREYASKYRDPAKLKANCRLARSQPTPPALPDEVQAALADKAESLGILLGDAIAAMTKAIGIPACGGCDKRRQWLNKAHAWIASYFSRKCKQ